MFTGFLHFFPPLLQHAGEDGDIDNKHRALLRSFAYHQEKKKKKQKSSTETNYSHFDDCHQKRNEEEEKKQIK
jgi:hypothetical protein